ncbi:MAG: hypothetical protein IPJ24_04040 [bacterium]|nr:hypothetical protein [bacterium]
MTSRGWPFVELPVLDYLGALIGRHSPRVFHGIGFVCVQHLLETTGTLFQNLVRLGADPADIFVLGKAYSTNDDVVARLRSLGVHVDPGSSDAEAGEFGAVMERDVARLWRAAEPRLARSGMRGIIVLDDGGRCIGAAPGWCIAGGRVVGIEQTQSGVARLPFDRLPIVLVAASAAKKIFESPLIARAIARKTLEAMAGRSLTGTIGIIGYGHVGRALAAELQREDCKLLIYDLAAGEQAEARGSDRWCHDLQDLTARSSLIFGCTGVDVFDEVEVDGAWFKDGALLASCSSEDIEFRSILRRWIRPDGGIAAVHRDHICNVTGVEVRVMRGGFPVNFDGSLESVPGADIQLTRGLLLGGIWQAALMLEQGDDVPGSAMLAPAVQAAVCRSWVRFKPRNDAGSAGELPGELLESSLLESESFGELRGVAIDMAAMIHQ